MHLSMMTDTATTQIYTLSLHDALPILLCSAPCHACTRCMKTHCTAAGRLACIGREAFLLRPLDNGFNREWTAAIGVGLLLRDRSEEHTSELQSRLHLVCRLLLEKKKTK